MKKSSLILLIFLAVTALKAQVGVNTESPQGVFHIDAARNTSGNTNVADDVVVDAQGRVGIGTNAPQTKVDIRSSTQGGGFRLQDGSQGNNMILTSDANGNGRWSAPGFSEFTRITPQIIPISVDPAYNFGFYKVFMLNQPDGTPYSIEFPSYGTYSVTIGARVNLSNLDANSNVSFFVLQLLPGNDISFWDAASPNRFEGSYEVYSLLASTISQAGHLFYLSQNITLTEATGKVAYFAMAIQGTDLPNPLTGYFFIGNGGHCPQCSGGSYVRIN
ncbi:hypothetical protein [Dysgonomonas sp. 520]|uniref:hypothetical protein n=1 Tax=Dysgonomonas sp. 520 TaxID=2302931 RepID=UPI0013D64C02|nr:hypothetical protein [Dysgonomonas sp. 520]NDW08167.1 hypothetical protein [Dysgonomonas sp. 520]